MKAILIRNCSDLLLLQSILLVWQRVKLVLQAGAIDVLFQAAVRHGIQLQLLVATIVGKCLLQGILQGLHLLLAQTSKAEIFAFIDQDCHFRGRLCLDECHDHVELVVPHKHAPCVKEVDCVFCQHEESLLSHELVPRLLGDLLAEDNLFADQLLVDLAHDLC